MRRAQLENVTIYAVGISSTKADLQRQPKPYKGRAPDTARVLWLATSAGNGADADDGNSRGKARRRFTGAGDLGGDAREGSDYSHQLEIATTATGGMHISTWKNQTIEKAIDEMGGELHSQYTLTYTPSGEASDGYHEI